VPTLAPSAATRPSIRITAWLFLRALGVIYLVAFVSLGLQIRGLAGENGIEPIHDLVDNARQLFDEQHIGVDRYRQLPTLAWADSSDASLVGQCAAGAALSVLVMVDVLPGPSLVLLWVLYLSISVAGQDFLSFQWDILLTEAGFLAIFLAPWQRRLRPPRDHAPSPISVWLLRWLGFRLMLESGAVKLLSGDATWRNLSALTFHFQTQPLPTWIGWYAHQLPAWWQTIACVVMFAIELGAPWLVFAPRRGRLAGFLAVVALQILILLTGNYGFFNYLTIAICFLWLDDGFLARVTPTRLWRLLAGPGGDAMPKSPFHAWGRHVAPALVAIVVVPVSIAEFADVAPTLLAPARAASAWLQPLRTVNSYGLFAVMTTRRLEIQIEGSDDNATWQPYVFVDKPGDVDRRPRFVAPHQPRLDWQMWFAALGIARQNPWFTALCVRLLQGSPDVTGLFAGNPFPDHPPHYIRAELFDYRFTTFAERRATGAWWVRSPAGEYLAAGSLR
jgi:hypothetical protein